MASSYSGSYRVRWRINEQALFNGIFKKLNTILQNDDFRYDKNKLLADFCDPYVPYETGALSSNVNINKTGVTYLQPYAHYQYLGLVYGPNYGPYVDKETGELRWRSPPGKGTKSPTGAQIQYNTEFHPLATDHWRAAMMRDRGDEFKIELGKLIAEYQ